jgi:uncharacterized protein
MTRSAKVLVVACVIASACSVLGPIPDHSRFYTLTASPPANADRAEAPGGTILYGLGPVVLPSYLDRNQVATRVSPTEVAYSQWDRWAEPLGANVSSVLLQSIDGELGRDAIVPYPWRGSTRVDYQIVVQLLRFESDTAGEAHLQSRWSIRDLERNRQLVARETTLTRPGRPGDTAASTAALSAMLTDLGHEIATALRALPSSSPAGPRRKRSGE